MTERPDLPETVFLPSERVQPGQTEVGVVLRSIDGVLVMLAFSSTGDLVAALGPDQPWIALPAHVADELAEDLGVAAILLDPDLSDDPPQED